MRYQGYIKMWDGQKGYGFIKAEGQPDTFVHVSEVIRAGYRGLCVDDVLSFEIVQGRKGLQAANILIIEKGHRNGNATS